MKIKLILIVIILTMLVVTGCSQASKEIITPPSVQSPKSVTNLTAESGIKMVNLIWEANSESNFAYYKIYRAEEKIPGDNSERSEYTILTTVNANAYQDNNVIDGTKYYYKVSAVNSASKESYITMEVSAIPSSYEFEYKWDVPNNYIFSLSLTPFNAILVGTYYPHTVYKFNSSGQIRSTLEVENSHCLAVDADNYLYEVVDAGGDWTRNYIKVNKYHPQGTKIATWEIETTERLSEIMGGILVSDGILFVVYYDGKYDFSKGGLYHFSWSTNTITEWATVPDDSFSPYGISADTYQNYFYVTDSANNRILKFDKNGTLITSWGKKGEKPGEFNYPRGIAVDIYGNIYVADESNFRIQKFDSNGNFITKWGGSPVKEDEIEESYLFPPCVAVDGIGRVYVADTWGNNKIKVFYPVEGFKP